MDDKPKAKRSLRNMTQGQFAESRELTNTNDLISMEMPPATPDPPCECGGGRSSTVHNCHHCKMCASCCCKCVDCQCGPCKGYRIQKALA